MVRVCARSPQRTQSDNNVIGTRYWVIGEHLHLDSCISYQGELDYFIGMSKSVRMGSKYFIKVSKYFEGGTTLELTLRFMALLL